MASPWELLIKAVKLFFSNLVYFLKYGLVYVGVVIISSLLILVPLILGGLFSIYSGDFSQGFNTTPLLFLIILIPAFVITVMWLSAGSYMQAKSVIENTKTSIKDLLKQGWGILRQFFFTGFLAGLIVMLGFLLLVLPGLIFAVWFTFALGVLLYEGKDRWQALKRSKDLVQGKFWKVAWYMTFPTLIVIVLQIVSLIHPAVSTLISISMIPAGTVLVIYSLLVYKTFAASPTSTPS